jgi:hypothetical protein
LDFRIFSNSLLSFVRQRITLDHPRIENNILHAGGHPEHPEDALQDTAVGALPGGGPSAAGVLGVDGEQLAVAEVGEELDGDPEEGLEVGLV